MAQMNISIPDGLKSWVESRVAEGRYSSTSDYVRDLVRRDQEAEEARRLAGSLPTWDRGPTSGKVSEHPMRLEDVRPKRAARLYDLVRSAGIDVSDWANYAKGDTAAAANPRYCYNWSFLEPGKVAVFNLWIDNMSEEGGRIVHRANYRGDAEESRAERRLPQAQTRGFALDEAIKAALRDDLVVRVIVNAGERRNRDDAEDEASRVRMRGLDSHEWTIVDYDWSTGACTMIRGRHSAEVQPV